MSDSSLLRTLSSILRWGRFFTIRIRTSLSLAEPNLLKFDIIIFLASRHERIGASSLYVTIKVDGWGTLKAVAAAATVL